MHQRRNYPAFEASMRVSVAFLLLTFSIGVSAEPAPSVTTRSQVMTNESIWSAAKAASWFFVGDFPDRRLYFDKSRVEAEGTTRTFLSRSDFKTPQKGFGNTADYMQLITYMRVDCERHLFANLQISTYAKDGSRADYTDYAADRPWKPIKPHSIGAEIEKAVCE